MSNKGSVNIIISIIIFYSFIGWGISQLYHENRPADMVAEWGVADPHKDSPFIDEDEPDPSWWGGICPSCYFAGGTSKLINGIWGFVKAIGVAIANVVHVASFTDERIPYLVNLLLILPMDIALILAVISLPFGGG